MEDFIWPRDLLLSFPSTPIVTLHVLHYHPGALRPDRPSQLTDSCNKPRIVALPRLTQNLPHPRWSFTNSLLKLGTLTLFNSSRTTWIICVMMPVSRASGRKVKSRNAPTLCEDVVHVPTTPDALQSPPSWNPANLQIFPAPENHDCRWRHKNIQPVSQVWSRKLVTTRQRIPQ